MINLRKNYTGTVTPKKSSYKIDLRKYPKTLSKEQVKKTK